MPNLLGHHTLRLCKKWQPFSGCQNCSNWPHQPDVTHAFQVDIRFLSHVHQGLVILH